MARRGSERSMCAASGTIVDVFPIIPITTGGGQEFGMRSGTENVPSIVGFAKAAEIAVAMRQSESERVTELRTQLLDGLKKIMPTAEVNGSAKADSDSFSTRTAYFK